MQCLQWRGGVGSLQLWIRFSLHYLAAFCQWQLPYGRLLLQSVLYFALRAWVGSFKMFLSTLKIWSFVLRDAYFKNKPNRLVSLLNSIRWKLFKNISLLPMYISNVVVMLVCWWLSPSKNIKHQAVKAGNYLIILIWKNLSNLDHKWLPNFGHSARFIFFVQGSRFLPGNCSGFLYMWTFFLSSTVVYIIMRIVIK